MNITAGRTTLALVAAFLSTGIAACSSATPAPTQQIQLPQEQATVTERTPTPCDDYLHGWERARCNL